MVLNFLPYRGKHINNAFMALRLITINMGHQKNALMGLGEVMQMMSTKSKTKVAITVLMSNLMVSLNLQ